MTPIPAPARGRAALLVAVLSLVVATGATSYAAGLAANSVGTPQLKAGAVSTPKLKAGAVTGAKIKDGSVGKQDLAPSAVPRAVVVDQQFPVEASAVVATVAGVRYTVNCQKSAGTSAQLVLTSATGTASALTARGLRSSASGPTPMTAPVAWDAVGDILFSANPGAADGLTSVELRVQHLGQPTSLVHATLRSAASGATPCLVDLVVTPTR